MGFSCWNQKYLRKTLLTFGGGLTFGGILRVEYFCFGGGDFYTMSETQILGVKCAQQPTNQIPTNLFAVYEENPWMLFPLKSGVEIKTRLHRYGLSVFHGTPERSIFIACSPCLLR